jgi:hypothetical protein
MASGCIVGIWTLLAGCGGAPAGGADGAKWQVVRAPGTSSCAAVVFEEPGDVDHREQIGQYNSAAEAEAALLRFTLTQDPMTVGGRTICR